MSDKYVCSKCGYPAENSTIFRQKEPPFTESPDCPNCGPTEIISKRRYAFRWGWQVIRESGTNEKVKEIPGTYLQLSEIGDERPKGIMRYDDLPKHVAEEFDEKSGVVQKILSEANIQEKLKKLGVNLSYHITVFDSE